MSDEAKSTGGRPSIYTDETAEIIAERLASGESLAAICTDDDMPSLRSVIRWSNENDAFGTIYAHAREAQAEVMDQKILTTADAATAEDASAARVKIDAYKWRAARLNPRGYGDRTHTEHSGKIQTEDINARDAVRSRVTSLAERSGPGASAGGAD